MKIAFFGYAWNPEFKVDAYMDETIESLMRAGADVDVYLGNQLSEAFGIYGIHPKLRVERVAEFIETEGYDAAIGFNNAMLLPEIVQAIRGRVATILVDEPEHLFDYRRTGPFDIFAEPVEIVAISTALEARIAKAVPGVEGRLHFRLSATRVAPPTAAAPPTVHPISWVASYLGDKNIEDFLTVVGKRPEFYALMTRCLELIERDGDLNTIKVANGPDAMMINALPWPFEYFEGQMRNILTNRRRVATVELLAPLGLHLFGNAGWLKLINHNAAVLQAFQPGPAPSRHPDLQRIYNASKIAINVPQMHCDPRAVQYRMIDIMASKALLITQHDDDSDLYRVFGKDCPAPTYRTLDELHDLCRHYLEHEDERRNLVAQCNALVQTGFDFEERARDLIELVGLKAPERPQPGRRRWLDLRLLYDAEPSV